MSKKLKVGYFADGPWSHSAIELISQRADIQFIVPRFDTRDPVLQEWAEKLSVPFFPAENVNSPDFLDWADTFKADLFISMSFNQILREQIINFAPLGFINCHAGALPFYRGRNPLNWAIINDEPHFGVTVHYVDEGIDTGDIINQKLCDITDEDDYNSLLEKAYKECASLLAKSIDELSSGTAKRRLQSEIHPVGTYFTKRIEGDERINFEWPSRRIFNFVRAIRPPAPCARAIVNGQEIAILNCRMIADAPDYIATAGEVLGRADDGVILKTGDNLIAITQIADADGLHIKNARTPKYSIGTRFVQK